MTLARILHTELVLDKNKLISMPVEIALIYCYRGLIEENIQYYRGLTADNNRTSA